MPEKEPSEMPDQTSNQQDQNLTNNPQPPPATDQLPATWEAWLNEQPEPVKALYQQHTTGLQNTVKATREERDTLARQIRDLSAKVEKGSETEKALTELSSKLEASERKTAFLEDAIRPEIGCRNPKAAYALAMAEQLFDRKGLPVWADIKAAAPELFGAPSVQANAGAGTQDPPKKTDMNTWIRTAANRS